MAFRIKATLKGYRVLGIKQGTSKGGKPWQSMTLFGDDATVEVSTTEPDLMMAISTLKPMDVINVDVRAIAGKERSYLILAGTPQLVQSADNGEIGY